VAGQTRHISPLDQSIALIELPLISDGRGNLTFAEGQRHIPFDIARVYFIYDVPRGIMRAGHAHRSTRQLMIACSGTFSVHFSNGIERQLVRLERPNQGILTAPMVWLEVHELTPGAVCLVLASKPYDESDYIRDYNQFLGLQGIA
jgi:hypothetical protein